jgi:hypothetical protein
MEGPFFPPATQTYLGHYRGLDTARVMNVFLLWHENELPGEKEEFKLVGVYSSKEAADAARQRAAQLPGFREAPDGFTIESYKLDQDQWQEGYVTAYPGE